MSKIVRKYFEGFDVGSRIGNWPLNKFINFLAEEIWPCYANIGEVPDFQKDVL